MFSHVMLGVNDIEASKAFYDAALGALGIGPGQIDAKGRVVYTHDGGRLMLSKPLNGEEACGANGGTVGFAAESSEAAKAWHDAGVTAGGASIEDPPGVRQAPGFKLYLAYLRDPSGNKLCALHRMAQ